MLQKIMKQGPAFEDSAWSGCSKRTVASPPRSPPVPKCKKLVSLSKNLVLGEPKDKIPSMADENLKEKSKSKGKEVPTALYKEASVVQQEPTTGHVKIKLPSPTHKLLDKKCKKTVSFAKDTKFTEMGSKVPSHAVKIALDSSTLR